MTTDLLSQEEIAAKIERLRGTGGGAAEAAPPFKYLRRFGEAADSLIDTVQNPDGRYMFGLPEIDARIRGVGHGELCLIVGFAHSGKTQVVLSSLIHNPQARVAFFTFDEVAELVLMKLACMKLGIGAERFEELIKAKDADAIAMLKRVATVEFPNLIVFDSPLNLGQMTEALKECERHWGAKTDLAVIDYLALLRCDADDIEGKSEAIKGWAKDNDVATVAVHQAGRGSAGKGEIITMTSGKYGGEQEAIFLIGVRRKRDDESLDQGERIRFLNTVSVSVVKNKRPPCKKTAPEGVDYWMEPETGFIRPLSHMDIPGNTSHVISTMSQAYEAKAQAEGRVEVPGQSSLHDLVDPMDEDF